MILLFCFLQPPNIKVSIPNTFQSETSSFSSTQFEPAVKDYAFDENSDWVNTGDYYAESGDTMSYSKSLI